MPTIALPDDDVGVRALVRKVLAGGSRIVIWVPHGGTANAREEVTNRIATVMGKTNPHRDRAYCLAIAKGLVCHLDFTEPLE